MAILTLITIFGNAHRPCRQLSKITTPSVFFSYFFTWKCETFHIWQFLLFIPVTGFQYHSVPVHSGDCSGEITGIMKFRDRSEILAGKFHWNGTGIHRNDRNLAVLYPPPHVLISADQCQNCWSVLISSGYFFLISTDQCQHCWSVLSSSDQTFKPLTALYKIISVRVVWSALSSSDQIFKPLSALYKIINFSHTSCV